jgi:serine/threonine-protein kinase HipA
MPIQPQSWDWDYGLLPIFEMNLPEGVLRARLQRQFAKALGHFDGLDLLAITGRHQLGRLSFSDPSQAPTQDTKQGRGFGSVDEILRARRDGGLFDYLMESYGARSGISGVQPKVLISDAQKFSGVSSSGISGQGRASLSLSSATHIVKLWEAREYPELAANEFFCLQAAKRAGLNVPLCELSDTGEALVVERFDLTVEAGEARYKGFEDFCVLNGYNTENKYHGSYEAKLFRRAVDYLAPATAHQDLRALFTLFVLNVILRNGDAHLKNFGVVYDSLAGEVRLAPVFDIVTTTAYLPQDAMALTLAGSTRWPDRAKLIKLGTTLCGLGPKSVTQIIEQVCAAVSATRSDLEAYFKDCPHSEVGEAIGSEWEAGLLGM